MSGTLLADYLFGELLGSFHGCFQRPSFKDSEYQYRGESITGANGIHNFQCPGRNYFNGVAIIRKCHRATRSPGNHQGLQGVMLEKPYGA